MSFIACCRGGTRTEGIVDRESIRNHPQLERFYAQRSPSTALDSYLSRVLDEAINRSYEFNASKINYRRPSLTRAFVSFQDPCRLGNEHHVALEPDRSSHHLGAVRPAQQTRGAYAEIRLCSSDSLQTELPEALIFRPL